jgi:hypothetical protein
MQYGQEAMSMGCAARLWGFWKVGWKHPCLLNLVGLYSCAQIYTRARSPGNFNPFLPACLSSPPTVMAGGPSTGLLA